MEFEVDVSGDDLFSNGYSIVVAKDHDIIKGFKFDRKLIQILRARQGEGRYRYPLTLRGKSFLRVRIYCIVIYYLFKDE